MRLSKLLTAVAVAAPLAVATAHAAVVTDPVSGHRYGTNADFGLSPGTWTAAQAAAQTAAPQAGFQTGHLVTVTSLAESLFLSTSFPGFTGWIGLSQPPGSPEPGTPGQTNCGGWQWVTGEAFCSGGTPTFENWGGGEPNNSGTEDFAHLTGGIDAQGPTWNDLPNGSVRGFIVEFDPNLVPEPGSLALLGLALSGLAMARRRKQ